MTSSVDQLLSEFMDAWVAGRRPDPLTYAARAAPSDQDELLSRIDAYLVWAPDPSYTEADIASIEKSPVVAELLAAVAADRALWPSLLPRLRAAVGASVRDVAGALSMSLGLASGADAKAARYLAEMEDGTLPPGGVSDRVFEALGRLFRMPASDLRDAGSLGGWSAGGAFARAAPSAPPASLSHLEVAADLLGAPAPSEWDEVDELFRGARGGA